MKKTCVSHLYIVVEARSRHRKSDGQAIHDQTEYKKVDVPRDIQDVHAELMMSGIAVYTGAKDVTGAAVVIVFCKNPGWEAEAFSVEHLTKILLYYWTLARKAGGQDSKVAVIADTRGSGLDTLNAMLQTLYTVEASQKEAISMVHVLADRVTQSLLFRSPIFRPQDNLKIDLITSIDTLYKFVDAKQLPAEIGGSRVLFHEEWVQFQQKLEPFMHKCRSVAQDLVSVMKELSNLQSAPETAEEAVKLMEQHEKHIQQAFHDPRLTELQEEGEGILEDLEKELNLLTYCIQCRRDADNARRVYKHVHHTVIQLVRLADTRMHRLELCQQLRQFEKASSQVIAWLTYEGKDILTKHDSIAENLKGITTQQKQLEKQYFNAMTQIEKANDLLDEAAMFSQSGQYDEVTGMREISRELKSRTRHFAGRLEDLRLRVEDTYKCLYLVDKAYDWALKAMKYVASMKMENTMSEAAVDKLLTSIESYLRDHPCLPQSSFDEMMDLSTKLRSPKIQDQCKVARMRCFETDRIIKSRQQMLRKARTQLHLEHQRRYSVMGGECYSPGPAGDFGSPTTTNVLPPVVLRRRSFAGKPSSPSYSPSAGAFKENIRDVNLTDYQERLFQEGLITEDMSDRIVASLPKSLADSTLRGSRDSLRGSRESLGSNENLARDQKSNSVPKELPGTKQSPGPPVMMRLPYRSSNRRGMHRVASLQIDSKGDVIDSGARPGNLKSLSMITGSTESLPSMAEEEEERQADTSFNGNRKQAWSPVPVNTHLMSRSGGGLTSYSSMADLRMTEEEVKKRRVLMMIMSEMLHTERDYVKSLQFVIDHYIPELMREDVPQALRGKRSTVFGNLEQIYQFHSRYFLAEIQHCETNPYQICHCFLQHENEFNLYALYNKNKPKSDALMEEHGRNFFKRKQQQLGDRLDLGSYLLKPVQRMGKYALLLRQIISECPETDPDYADLRQALDMVRFQLRHGNDLLAMDSLKDCDVSLQEQGQLLRQEEFLVWQGRKKCLRHVFLFEELVVFSKTKRSAAGHDVYIYKSSIKTSDLGLTETIGSSGYKFELWFRRRKTHETYVLQAKSSEMKNAWVQDISRLLWQQAVKNREVRFSVMAKMGIGNKPCLDLKASDDNINDRFVNLGNRAPRTRNSVAVSSFDHMKDGTNRPQSIISVSSSSSSNSSKSSGYGTGCDSIAEDTRTSKGYSKAFTVSSAESGIGSDLSPDSYTERRVRPAGVNSPTSPASPMSLVHDVIIESDV